MCNQMILPRAGMRNPAVKTETEKNSQKYRKANQEAARIILADIERYGRGSLMHEWASAALNGPEAATRCWWRTSA